MSTFDKDLCMKNIYFQAKAKNIKIGELETAAGVSAGYLSRLTKEGNEGNPNIETLCAISEKLEMPLDILLTVDLSGLSGTEAYMVKFLRRLIEETKEDKVSWKFDGVDALYRGDCQDNKLVKYKTDEFVEGYAYYSLFGQNYRRIDDEMYRFSQIEGQEFYLAKVNEDATNRDSDSVYEMYFCSGDEVKKLCSSNKGVNKAFIELLDELYQVIHKKIREPKVEDDVKEAIDIFMGDKFPF